MAIFSLLLSGCSLPFLKKKKAALQIEASPQATVFLNGEHVGQTPFFNDQLKAGEYNLKLVPETKDKPFLNWEGIIKLNPGIMTVVKRKLATSEDQVSGYVLTLEPIDDKQEAKISLISTPDSAVVNLDGEPKGFTPLVLDNIVEGERLLSLSSPGFQEETVKAKTAKGYKLMINVQLGRTGTAGGKEKQAKEATPSSSQASPSAKLKTSQEASSGGEMAKPYVKIKETPTGWLNVRSQPSTAKKEETILGKIDPGEVYKFIKANETGWYKIEYQEGKEGWISGKYAQLYR